MSAPSRLIVFAHANGFPAGTYRLLFEAWRERGFRVEAIERFGHDEAYPVTSNWPRLRDQLIDFIRPLGAQAYLVGHSLGGFLSLLVACARPALARGVVLLDAPLVAGWRAHGLHMAKASGLIERISPGRVSQRRRQHWPSRDAAREHFGAKAVFARWDPRVLDDYVAAGIESGDEGVRLRFGRSVETSIYNTLPHHLPAVLMRHPPRCPIAFIGGTQSAEVRQVGLAATRAVTRNRLAWIEGTHLYPMERPAQTAGEVLRWIEAFEAAGEPSG